MSDSVRNAPRITLNALAEYMTASASRRRTILAEQRDPKAFRVAYYAEAEAAIVSALSDGRSVDALDEGRKRVLALPVSKEWDASRRQTQLEALEAARSFLRTDEAAKLPTLALNHRKSQTLPVGRVAISVRPELFISSASGTVVGALKLFFSKTTAMAEERARYAGALLHLYTEVALAAGPNADCSNCFVVDVFAKKVFTAPRTFRRRRLDINAACEEIAAGWSTQS